MPSEKKIPRVSSSSEQARDIDGIRWVVSRLPASRSPEVLSRLFADVGEVVVELLCSPTKEISPDIEPIIRAGLQRWMGQSAEITMSAIKSVILTSALSRAKDLDLPWYVKQLLPGSITANGVEIDTMAELDETNMGAVGLMELVWHALVVNFRPTSTALATFVGSDGADERPPMANSIRGTSSWRGETPRDGQSAQA